MTTLAAVAARLAQGEPLQHADAAVVLESHDLVAIGMMADEARRRRHGVETTFVRVFEVHVDALPSSVPAATSAGELRIVGRPASVAAAVAAVSAVRGLAAGAPLFGFSLRDLEELDGSLESFGRLRAAGLDGIAEVPVDLVSSALPVRAARAAGLAVLRLTVDSAPDDLLDSMIAAQKFSLEAGEFRAFAPLPRRLSATAPTTGYDDVKCVALARLLLDVASIQVDWPLYGPKLAQVGLIVGADDIDGVTAAEPGLLGPRRTAIEEVLGNILAAGLQPVERDGRFNRLATAGAGTRG
jgi:aminodeoxyfutalosine synthase